jgi:hypothetical protein
MKVRRGGHATRVSLDDGQEATVTTVALDGFVTFIFIGPGVEIIITFPIDSVVIGLGGDDGDVV